MIYDCFVFFNELDLLEIRLNVLASVVDRFVLVEGTKTFTGRDKPLYFQENRQRYAAFLDKIIHVVVDDFPPADPAAPESAWIYENHQRNAIVRGLAEARPEDVVLFSDADEIPNPEAIRTHAHTPGIKCLEQFPFTYFLNYLSVSTGVWCMGKMLTYGEFIGAYAKYKVAFSMFVPEPMNRGATVNRIRHVSDAIRIPNGGWHFSFLGGVEAILRKIQSFAHSEIGLSKALTPEAITQRIQEGRGIYRAGERSFAVPIDETFPEYIRINRERYAHLIYEVTPEYLKRTRCRRLFYTCLGRFTRWIENHLIPRWLHWKLARIRFRLRRLRLR